MPMQWPLAITTTSRQGKQAVALLSFSHSCSVKSQAGICLCPRVGQQASTASPSSDFSLAPARTLSLFAAVNKVTAGEACGLRMASRIQHPRNFSQSLKKPKISRRLLYIDFGFTSPPRTFSPSISKVAADHHRATNSPTRRDPDVIQLAKAHQKTLPPKHHCNHNSEGSDHAQRSRWRY